MIIDRRAGFGPPVLGVKTVYTMFMLFRTFTRYLSAIRLFSKAFPINLTLNHFYI